MDRATFVERFRGVLSDIAAQVEQAKQLEEKLKEVNERLDRLYALANAVREFICRMDENAQHKYAPAAWVVTDEPLPEIPHGPNSDVCF